MREGGRIPPDSYSLYSFLFQWKTPFCVHVPSEWWFLLFLRNLRPSLFVLCLWTDELIFIAVSVLLFQEQKFFLFGVRFSNSWSWISWDFDFGFRSVSLWGPGAGLCAPLVDCCVRQGLDKQLIFVSCWFEGGKKKSARFGSVLTGACDDSELISSRQKGHAYTSDFCSPHSGFFLSFSLCQVLLIKIIFVWNMLRLWCVLSNQRWLFLQGKSALCLLEYMRLSLSVSLFSFAECSYLPACLFEPWASWASCLTCLFLALLT